MALAVFKDLVYKNLAFLADPGDDAKIATAETEAYWELAKCKGYDLAVDETAIELAANWTGLWRILAADLASYNMLFNKVVEIVGGVDGAAPTGSKRIKRGKAGPAEAEFDYAKASDGSTLSMQATTIINGLKMKICQNASTLGCSLPMCGIPTHKPKPPFVAYVLKTDGTLE